MSTQILLIDPDINFMVSIKTALEGTGEFQVKVASTMFMVDEQLLHGAPDVAVVAFDMPDIDIMELLQHIRQLRPDLPLIITPLGAHQYERAPLLGADDILGKPYQGRDLIPVVRAVLDTAEPQIDAPPAPTKLLDPHQIPDQPDQPTQRDPGATKRLEPLSPSELDSPFTTDHPRATNILRDTLDQIQAEYDAGQTRRFNEATNTDPYDPFDSSAPIIERRDTPADGEQDSSPDQSDYLPQTKPLPARYDEPPFAEGDTPPVPDHDSPAMRTFLATDQSDVPPDDFGEALDAIARSRAAEEAETTPLPDEFHDLVNSMRPSDRAKGVSRLEELIHSLGSDFADEDKFRTPEAGVDFVLDAMRRGQSPLGSSASLFDLDDTTIGEVIDGLFEPSFEGVLAAMSGESVDEDQIQEPTYETTAEIDPRTGDHAKAEQPPTLPEEGFALIEPPIETEDSRSYPATAALTALTALTDEDHDTGRISLDDLLDQIEAQLPPARSHRPRLKPLPSWKKSELATGAHKVAAMFDHVEGAQTPPQPPETQPESLAAAEPHITEPDISTDDTIPSQALLDAMDSVQDDRTRPAPPIIPDSQPVEAAAEDEVKYETKYYTGKHAVPDQEPDDAESGYGEPESRAYSTEDYADSAETGPIDTNLIGEAAHPATPIRMGDAGPADEDEYGEYDEYDEAYDEPPRDEFDTAFNIEFDTNLLTMEDLLAIADLPDTEEIQREIMERAAAARAEQIDAELGLDTADDDHYQDEEAEPARPRTFGPEDTFDAESDEAAYYANLASHTASAIFPPDESQLVPLDSDTAAMIIETGASSLDELEQIERDQEDEAGDAVLAAIAVQLTQFSLESSVQATMISRAGQRLAEAGNLSDGTMEHLFELVERAWASSQASASLIRYITLPDVGECLLYSTQVDMGLILSMIFNAATSVRTIRRQARRLSESLELVPEETDSPAAETLPSRPTDLVRPKGWDEAVQKLEALTSNERGADASIPVRPEREKDVVYTAYTCLWLPADPTLELLDDLAEGLAVWIEDIAAENAWNVDDLTIFPDYVLVSLRAPEDILPDDAIMHLMDETARLSEDYFPEATNDGPFWTDGYYMVSPPRDLSDREIARFITYQRQAQLG